MVLTEFEPVNVMVNSYNSKFPPALMTLNGRIYGVWVLGNNYRNDTKFYGQFPHSVLDRIMALFPDKKNILHLFSGTLKANNNIVPDNNGGHYTGVVTYDVNLDFKVCIPTIPDDVRNILNHAGALSEMELVIADPPYDKKDFEQYGTKPFNKPQVLRDLAKILKKGSHVVWLDTRKIMYSKKDWFLLGEIMVSVSTNHRYRGLCIFEKL